MLIVIVAWVYVVLLMALTEHSVIAGIMTFLLYGLLPLSVITYLLNTPARRARRRAQEAEKESLTAAETGHQPDANNGVDADSNADADAEATASTSFIAPTPSDAVTGMETAPSLDSPAPAPAPAPDKSSG